MRSRDSDDELPPMHGERPKAAVVDGVPVVVYLNGKPITLSKKEAIGLALQIMNILAYFEERETETIPAGKRG